jgi:hypothetical protein
LCFLSKKPTPVTVVEPASCASASAGAPADKHARTRRARASMTSLGSYRLSSVGGSQRVGTRRSSSSARRRRGGRDGCRCRSRTFHFWRWAVIVYVWNSTACSRAGAGDNRGRVPARRVCRSSRRKRASASS